MTFPRIRDKNFSYQSYETIPAENNGRLDLMMNDIYSLPNLYKVVAAANHMSNPMLLRPTIRPYEESIRNELILKGYSGEELERLCKEAIDAVVVDNYDWLSYGDNVNGVITEAETSKVLFTPSPESAATWYGKYNTIKE